MLQLTITLFLFLKYCFKNNLINLEVGLFHLLIKSVLSAKILNVTRVKTCILL